MTLFSKEFEGLWVGGVDDDDEVMNTVDTGSRHFLARRMILRGRNQIMVEIAVSHTPIRVLPLQRLTSTLNHQGVCSTCFGSLFVSVSALQDGGTIGRVGGP